MAGVADALSQMLRDDAYEGRDMFLLVRTGLPLETAVRLVAAAFLAESETFPGVWPGWGMQVAPTLDGPVVLVQRDDLDERLPRMVAELDRAGVPDGQIEMYESAHPTFMHGFRPVPFLECRLAVHGTRVPPRPGNWLGYWEVEPATREMIVAQAARWCLELPAERTRSFLDAHPTTWQVPRPQVADMLELTARVVFAEHILGIHGPVQLIVEGEHGFRMAVLSLDSGYVSFVDGSLRRSDFNWSRSLAAVTAPLSAASEWAVRGLVKRGSRWHSTCGSTLSNDWVPVYDLKGTPAIDENGSWAAAEVQRDIEGDYLLDAFGSVVIPANQRDLLPADWEVKQVGRLLLAQHPEPEAWFGQEKPDPQIHTAARHEMRALLPPQAENVTENLSAFFLARTIDGETPEGQPPENLEYRRSDGSWTIDRALAEPFGTTPWKLMESLQAQAVAAGQQRPFLKDLRITSAGS